jgi:hypothetical protein
MQTNVDNPNAPAREFQAGREEIHTLPLVVYIPALSWYHIALNPSSSLGETNSVATEVVNRVVSAEEHITWRHIINGELATTNKLHTNNPQRASRQVDIHARE